MIACAICIYLQSGDVTPLEKRISKRAIKSLDLLKAYTWFAWLIIIVCFFFWGKSFVRRGNVCYGRNDERRWLYTVKKKNDEILNLLRLISSFKSGKLYSRKMFVHRNYKNINLSNESYSIQLFTYDNVIYVYNERTPHWISKLTNHTFQHYIISKVLSDRRVRSCNQSTI